MLSLYFQDSKEVLYTYIDLLLSWAVTASSVGFLLAYYFHRVGKVDLFLKHLIPLASNKIMYVHFAFHVHLTVWPCTKQLTFNSTDKLLVKSLLLPIKSVARVL